MDETLSAVDVHAACDLMDAGVASAPTGSN